MYPLDLLMIEHKRIMYLEIWNQERLRDVPAQMDDGSAPNEQPTDRTSHAPSMMQSDGTETSLLEQS